MPAPVTIVDAGGLPVTVSEFGVPLTPTNELEPAILAIPIMIVEAGGLPVNLVNEDLSPYEVEE